MVDELANNSVDTEQTAEAVAEAVEQAAPEVAPVAQEATQENEVSMEELIKQYDAKVNFRRGSVVEGTVARQTDEGWLVDFGFKCEGLLPKDEWTQPSLVETVAEPKAGDKISVQLVSTGSGEEPQPLLSRAKMEYAKRWRMLEAQTEENPVVTIKGLRATKGGLVVNAFGLEGFIPVSHICLRGQGITPAKLVDTEFEAKLIEKDKRKHRIIFSRTALLEGEFQKLREEFFATAHEGDIVEGPVTSVADFGIFVNLNGVEGLVHATELGYRRGAKPKDLYKKGDQVKAKILKINTETGKVSLSIKATLPNPWETIAERFAPGTVFTGRVTSLTNFGAFVELEPGIEGLIHIGDLSWKRIKSASEVVQKGQDVTAIVIDINTEAKRISLGYKQLNDPWKGIAEKYPKDSQIEVKIARIADFGAFAKIEDDIDGLIHISQISNERIKHPGEVLKIGDTVTARVLEVNEEERRIRLSLKDPNDRRPNYDYDDDEDEHRQAPRRSRKPHREQSAVDFLPQEEMNVSLGDLLGKLDQ